MLIADPSFGLDIRLQAVITLLNLQEPFYAEFDEGSQQYRISFQTWIVYPEEMRPEIVLSMFPGAIPDQVGFPVAISIDPSGRLVVKQYGPVPYPEQLQPSKFLLDIVEPIIIGFDKPHQVVDSLWKYFEEQYQQVHNPGTQLTTFEMIDRPDFELIRNPTTR